jgi:hypothetical protein
VTKLFSSNLPSIALVIPVLQSLKKVITNMLQPGLGSTKEVILKSLQKRFFSTDGHLDILTDPLYVLPTMLDPRYKNTFPSAVFDNAKHLLNDAVMTDIEDDPTQEASREPDSPPQGTEQNQENLFWCLDEVLSQSSSETVPSASNTAVNKADIPIVDIRSRE